MESVDAESDGASRRWRSTPETSPLESLPVRVIAAPRTSGLRLAWTKTRQAIAKHPQSDATASLTMDRLTDIEKIEQAFHIDLDESAEGDLRGGNMPQYSDEGSQ